MRDTHRVVRLVVVGIAMSALAAVGCGGGGNDGGNDGATVPTPAGTPAAPGRSGPAPGTPSASGSAITISGLRFSPLDLSVTPGATITVTNNDGMPHSVTSEATPGAYVRGAVGGVSFDTGEFSSGQRTIQIPASAPIGTVIPFYCTSHRGTMATPNGSITIAGPTQPPPATPSPTPTPTPPVAPVPGY
jgi:plastocyanin